MNLMLVIFKYQWLKFKNSFLGNLAFLFFFPILLFVLIALPLCKPYQKVEMLFYLGWVTPGIWIISSSFTAFIFSYSDMRKIRFESKTINTFLKSPISIWNLLIGSTLWSFFIGMIQLAISILLIKVINTDFIAPLKIYFAILFQTLPIVFFFAVLGTTFGCWLKNNQSQLFITLILFMLVSFGGGGFIPMSDFPEIYSQIIEKIPPILDIVVVHRIILNQESSILSIMITTIISMTLFIINGVFCYNIFRKSDGF